jgi:FlaA1/EpsC-like NDP-sugar epimerase
MSRFVARSFQIFVDLFALALAYGLAFMLRFEFDLGIRAYAMLFITAPYVVVLQYVVLVLFGIPRFAWRYVGLREAIRIFGAVGASIAILACVRLILGSTDADGDYGRYAAVPLGVLAIDFALAFLALAGVRILRRLQSEERARRGLGVSPAHSKRTVLIGAGQAGVIVAKEIAARPDLGIVPVGFLDDDALKMGTVVHGLPVLGMTDALPRIAARHRVEQAIIAMADAPGSAVRRIVRLCQDAGLQTKIIPGVYEIVGGRVNLSRIRSVAIEDLLRREPVQLEESAIAEFVRGRCVLVSGAGGSIGSELCRQVARLGPSRLVLLERAENALFEIHRELCGSHPDLEIVPRVGDVADAERVDSVLSGHPPEVLFHAAAHKHVPMMEYNPCEAVKNNVHGTRVLADAAAKHGVEVFVMISTDKAVNPTSVMGATKRVAEMYVQALSQRSRTRFVAVRFGNVLGSAGSVIPIFRDQIARGGPVTVTHPEMKRYFMTIPEACQLVMQSAVLGVGGEIFILDMGDPVRIVDLAEDLITLSGFKPGEEIELAFTGIRPGEKLIEELAMVDEHADKTRHPRIFVGRFRPNSWELTCRSVDELYALAKRGSDATLIAKLSQVVPEYGPPQQPAARPPELAKSAEPVVAAE